MKDAPQAALFLKASELFKKHGVKSLTMDDVAREMGMSKKTIYRYVKDKRELVRLSMEFYLKADQQELDAILKQSGNAVDEMIRMVMYFITQTKELDISVLLDVQKYYSETWELYDNYRNKYILSLIAGNLENGIKEKYYRDDFNPDIISRVFIRGVDILTDPRLFPANKYVFADLYREFIQYHLRGVLSPKGLEYIEQHNLFKS